MIHIGCSSPGTIPICVVTSKHQKISLLPFLLTQWISFHSMMPFLFIPSPLDCIPLLNCCKGTGERNDVVILLPKFGDGVGKMATILFLPFGLKTAGAALRSHLEECMENMEQASCHVNPDHQLKPMVKIGDRVAYYSCILYYEYDIFCIHHDANSFYLGASY